MRHRRVIVATGLALSLVWSTTAYAHPDHGSGGREDFPGEGVAEPGDKQHDGEGGHLPARQDGVRVVGKAPLSAPPGTNGDMTGRVADVSAHGDHAFLTAFRADDCLGGGAWVVDISDPTAPEEMAFLPTTPGSYAGEGSQTIVPEYGPYAGRALFLHQNETCDAALAAAAKPAPHLGGINIWDVTDVATGGEQLLVEHAGDVSVPGGGTRANPNTVHSMFAWNSHVDQRVYAVLVDNVEFTDVDIFDITDPTQPVEVNDTLDLVDLFDVDQDEPANLTSVFNHDMMVYRVGERYVMNVNYWDGGYVLLDVTDPRPGQVSLIAESDYAELDEERLARGHEISPEGNGHQSELSPDFNYLIGTDEDFDPYRVAASITSGPYAGAEFSAVSASDTPPVDEHVSIVGTPVHVGLACPEEYGDDHVPVAPVDGGVALVERGVCAFQEKLDTIVAAGYDAGIVFNNERPDCQSFVRMLAEGDIPFLFVQRSTGLQVLGVPGAEGTDACPLPTPEGAEVAGISIEAVFDGWGYVRLFRTDIPREPGVPGSIRQIDTYAIPESQDPAFARDHGDLSVHEVAIDPRPGARLAYLSYYAGGFRVVKYGPKGLEEVGAFIDEGGNNFWGVEVHQHAGDYYVLASDRDYGLYILQYDGHIPGGSRGGKAPKKP